jgi:hypothetical protein
VLPNRGFVLRVDCCLSPSCQGCHLQVQESSRAVIYFGSDIRESLLEQ